MKINLQKLVDICGYELPTNTQNFTQKDLTEVKIFQKSFRGLLFSDTPCRSYAIKQNRMSFSVHTSYDVYSSASQMNL